MNISIYLSALKYLDHRVRIHDLSEVLIVRFIGKKRFIDPSPNVVCIDLSLRYYRHRVAPQQNSRITTPRVSCEKILETHDSQASCDTSIARTYHRVPFSAILLNSDPPIFFHA